MVIWNHWNRRYQQLWAKIDHIYYGDLWKESKNIDHCFENIEWTSMLSFIARIYRTQHRTGTGDTKNYGQK